MPRRKSVTNCAIPFWMSAKPDCKENRFIQAGNSLLLSPEFHKLSMGARYLYLCTAMEAGGRRNFTFPQSSAIKYSINPRSMRRYLQELISAGFIEVESSGRWTRESNRYLFSTRWRSHQTAGI
ncbi:hypothetical protein B5F88_12090 [Flavonifractor sp. An306]|nr:hypothetical protein B5F88_12090 [Flavonifractor sp. An306]